MEIKTAKAINESHTVRIHKNEFNILTLLIHTRVYEYEYSNDVFKFVLFSIGSFVQRYQVSKSCSVRVWVISVLRTNSC